MASDVALGRALGATTLLVRTGHGAATLASGAARADHVVADLGAAAERIETLLAGDGRAEAAPLFSAGLLARVRVPAGARARAR